MTQSSRFLTFVACLLLAAGASSEGYAQALGKPILKMTRIESEVGANRRYGFSRIRGHTRLGRRAQRFEIRHGDCGGNPGWDDCTNDRQRVERKEDPKNRIQKVGQQVWYGWSLFLDPSYPDLWKTNAAFGQVKMRHWRSPIWMIKLREGRIALNLHATDNCYIGRLAEWRGRWMDFTLFADYSTSPKGPSVVLYLNGEKVCTYGKPLVTPAMARINDGTLYVKYGIYNSYVSRWLNRNKTLNVSPEALDDRFSLASGVGGSASSPASAPFKYDWGVKLPTQIAFYDEMRFGKTREAVDVRMIEASGGKPVD